LGRRPLGAILHSSNEPGELSQWICHDDSTIVLDIIIIMKKYIDIPIASQSRAPYINDYVEELMEIVTALSFIRHSIIVLATQIHDKIF